MKIRQDQQDSLRRVAAFTGMTVSETVRWILDAGLDAIERSRRSLQEESP